MPYRARAVALIERSYYLPITGSRNFLAGGKFDKKGR